EEAHRPRNEDECVRRARRSAERGTSASAGRERGSSRSAASAGDEV
ncbi:MAG: hypothetical protein AVDCRST_MAG60-512, partial [uncultured Nocardioides sp.]